MAEDFGEDDREIGSAVDSVEPIWKEWALNIQLSFLNLICML